MGCRMTKSTYKCSELLSLCNRYQQDPRGNLGWFVKEVRKAVEALEDWAESTIRNQAIQHCILNCEHSLRELNKEWTAEAEAEVINTHIDWLVASYRTMAAHHIVKLKRLVEDNNLSTGSFQFVQHGKSKQYFGKAIRIVQEGKDGGVGLSVESLATCVTAYCYALQEALVGLAGNKKLVG